MRPTNKGRRFARVSLPDGIPEKIIAARGTRRWQHVRDQAVLTFMWRTGARTSEITGLRLCEIDPPRLRIMRPKGWQRAKNPAPARTVGLDGIAMRSWERWLLAREAQFGPTPLDSAELAFPTAKGGALPGSYLRALLPRLARQVGYGGRVHPHCLRHTFACECVLEGRTVAFVKNCLGHDSVLTTQIYLDSLMPLDVVEGMCERAS